MDKDMIDADEINLEGEPETIDNSFDNRQIRNQTSQKENQKKLVSKLSKQLNLHTKYGGTNIRG